MELPKVGIVYDHRMCAHACPDDPDHPETPERVTSIIDRLESVGILERCVRVEAREATTEELASVHSEKHIALMKAISSKTYGKGGRAALAHRYNSIYFNEGSSQSALLAAGSVVELSLHVAKGELSAGAAVVRPPGHHAEADEAMGFCLFNNVAIAAHILVHGKAVTGVKRVLIVDWDVHHGNGTQHMFWNDPQVLYFSIHRYDYGGFYPGGDDGYYDKIGASEGAGYNINVPWPHGGFGDGDYLAVWEYLLMPIAKNFNPDIVLVSAGFDSAEGDPLGGCKVTPYGYSHMMHKLMELAGGKVVLALEGGYNLHSIAHAYDACLQILLGESPIESPRISQPLGITWCLLEEIRQEIYSYWPCLGKKIEIGFVEIESSEKEETFESISSDGECQEAYSKQQENWITTEAKTIFEHETSCGELVVLLDQLEVSAKDKSTLSIEENEFTVSEADVETQDSYVWYASYGSNMWYPRFMCYILGGQVPPMARPCAGARDRSLPVESEWLVVPHRLFFGHTQTSTWGKGGVAFLHPTPCEDGLSSHIRIYKIKLQQLNDLFSQENRLEPSDWKTWLDTSHIEVLRKGYQRSIELIKDCWYGAMIYLGERGGLPILAITCCSLDINNFEEKVHPINPPSPTYADVILRGLTEGRNLSKEEARSYIDLRSTF